MNELSEFFSSVAKEKKRVEEEKIRFTPRVNVNLSDLSGFFGTITEAKREHIVIAKRDTTNDSTKLDACLLYTSPSPRDNRVSRMPSSA